jgi:SAM-dependent methyltransferase
MLLHLLHRAAAVGWIYDCTQWIAGASFVRRRLQPVFAECPPGGRILDVGGGTGSLEALVPPSCSYVCLDLEIPKLRRYVSKSSGAMPLQADATRMPVQTGSIDLVACVCVSHHLSESEFTDVLEESARVLRPGGQFVLLDPVLNPRRLPGRVLWRLDRGSYPKTAPALRSALAARFQVSLWRSFAVWHSYVLGVGLRP